jgi:hypothetical protein
MPVMKIMTKQLMEKIAKTKSPETLNGDGIRIAQMGWVLLGAADFGADVTEWRYPNEHSYP